MKTKYVFIISAVVSLIACGIYFYYFFYKWGLRPQPNSSEWGGFGSYIGGVVGPILSFLSAYLVYKTLSQDTQIRKIELIKDNMLRIDAGMEKMLDSPFNNPIYGEHYIGQPFRLVLRAAAYGQINPDEDFESGALASICNLAILGGIVNAYLKLCYELDDSQTYSEDIKNVELIYWHQKYGLYCGWILQLFGEQKIRSKVGGRYLNLKVFGIE